MEMLLLCGLKFVFAQLYVTPHLSFGVRRLSFYPQTTNISQHFCHFNLTKYHSDDYISLFFNNDNVNCCPAEQVLVVYLNVT